MEGYGAARPGTRAARRLAQWVEWASAATSAPIAVGGVHATVAPEAVAAIPGVRFVGVGEADMALPELCATIERGGAPSVVAGFWVRTAAGWRRNPSRPFLEDLDALPDPDYALFDFANLYNVRRGYFPFIMSRGCAYRCTYCCCDTLRHATGAGGRFWRFQSPEHAVAQLRRLLDRHPVPVEIVQFLDAIMFPNKAWLRRFTACYRAQIGLPFSANLRADMLDAEIAQLLASAGCRTLRFGVESGDPWLTRDVLRRQLTIQDIREAFAVLEATGIERWAYNMVGLPHEDLRRALATIRLNADIGPDLAIPFIFYPYPGTELYKLCERNGWLTGTEYDHYFQGVALDLPTISRGDVLFLHRFFRPLVRLYGVARSWPAARRRRWYGLVDAVLASPLLPRGAIAATRDRYKSLRHVLGERILKRSPGLYRLLGGTDPV